MATATNKQRLVTQIFTQLAPKYAAPDAPVRPILEEFVYAILREGHTREAADRAFDNLKKHFFDWNEIRVSMTEELVAAIGHWITDAERRSQRSRSTSRNQVQCDCQMCITTTITESQRRRRGCEAASS